MKTQTLKGFRDFLPQEARKRQYVIDKLKTVFESYGFEPLETPALEYEEVLLGKYGDEGDKLMYRFEDLGKRRVALRYDQTVPLARVVAQYANTLPLPFKRYQIQPVWRAENTQKGRFREFLQCDIDTVGSTSLLSDAEILKVVFDSFKALGFDKFKILINDRENLKFYKNIEHLSDKDNIKVIRSIDKLKKIGEEGVLNDLKSQGFSDEIANNVLELVKTKKPTGNLEEIFSLLNKMNVPSEYFEFDPALARGLDYYTGLIFEVELEGYLAGSLCGGGRYDKLVGMFANRDIPAVGCAFGFDRIIEAMEELKLFPDELATTKVLVTIFSPELKDKSIEVSSLLRKNDINSELWLDPDAKMEKQLKYADQKKIPYVVVIGPDEIQNNQITLKEMSTREQKKINIEELVKAIGPKSIETS